MQHDFQVFYRISMSARYLHLVWLVCLVVVLIEIFGQESSGKTPLTLASDAEMQN